jgi:hypothetical protein
MTNQHPISVPQELLNQWCRWNPGQTPEGLWRKIADNAAQWGANTELEKCCEWVSKYLPYLGDFPMPEDKLRAARRPKPPTLKEQALALVSHDFSNQPCLSEEGYALIRRALEALPNE